MQILICGHQKYDWGKPGVSSLIHLIQSSNPSLVPTLDPESNYAELWIGTHSNLPSFLENSAGTTLKEYLKQNPEFLGENHQNIEKNEENQLPFLMKVLSVGKSLSIQAHPDKELARRLNEKSPHIYKDANHKPEMAIALTKFEALCNFTSFEKIQENLKNYPEFEVLFQTETLETFQKRQNSEALSELVSALFNIPEALVKDSIFKMVSRIHAKQKREARDNVILRLQEQFPFDIGILFSLLMNYTVLNPGECLIMRPNEPHAYIQGECIECMANSDNVVRAGLTPKLKDIETLSKMLTYKMGDPQFLTPTIIKNREKDGYDCIVFKSEFREFHCSRLFIPTALETEEFCSPFPFVGFVFQGSGTFLPSGEKPGKVDLKEFQQFFIPAKMSFRFACKDAFQIYLCGSW